MRFLHVTLFHESGRSAHIEMQASVLPALLIHWRQAMRLWRGSPKENHSKINEKTMKGNGKDCHTVCQYVVSVVIIAKLCKRHTIHLSQLKDLS